MIQKGSNVQWKWGQGIAQGKVQETYAEEVTRTLGGSKVTRLGAQGNKALLIEQQDGSQVLKLESEVKKA
mgnify:CR=1 FL=1